MPAARSKAAGDSTAAGKWLTASVVSGGEFADAELLLVAHGSTVNAESATAALDHAQALRESGTFLDVRAAFWKQKPFLGEAAGQLTARRVFVVPLFLSEGFFTDEVIPRELGFLIDGTLRRVQRRGDSDWFYCGPIGTDPSMTSVILARAEEALGSGGVHVDVEETALFLAAHGTSRNDQSRRASEMHRDVIRQLGRFAEVHATFLEEEPRIADIPRISPAPNVVVVPFFVSDGLHAREDVPTLLGEDPGTVRERLERGESTWVNPTERGGKKIWCARSIGTAPLVREVIMARVRQAAAGNTEFPMPKEIRCPKT